MERRRAFDAISLEASPLTAWPERLRPGRFTLLTAAIAALGAALVPGRGVVLGADSAHYIAAARSLLAGEGILRVDGRPIWSG